MSFSMYVNLYQQSGLSNLIGWKSEVGMHINLFSMSSVKRADKSESVELMMMI